MTNHREPPYGERVVSWRAVLDELQQDFSGPPEFEHLADELYRLRGLVMAQCAETEAILGQVLDVLDHSAVRDNRTAGQLLNMVEQRLPADLQPRWAPALADIREAIRSRNRVVHADVSIGSSWAPYATGGGEYVPVISMMGADAYDGSDLLRDLVLQQESTVLAARLLLAVQERRSSR
jgi:hypothetical protein